MEINRFRSPVILTDFGNSVASYSRSASVFKIGIENEAYRDNAPRKYGVFPVEVEVEDRNLTLQSRAPANLRWASGDAAYPACETHQDPTLPDFSTIGAVFSFRRDYWTRDDPHIHVFATLNMFWEIQRLLNFDMNMTASMTLWI